MGKSHSGKKRRHSSEKKEESDSSSSNSDSSESDGSSEDEESSDDIVSLADSDEERAKKTKEDRLREKNRLKTMGRSRMWQTVGSDDDDLDMDSSDGDNDKASKHKKKKHKKERHRKEEKKSRKHKKKHKHKHKHKKDKKSKRKKEKKHKKHKKSKDKKDSKIGAVDQNEYGRYGVIKMEHFYQKQREFEAWLSEVKQIPDMAGMSKFEQQNYFKEFMEDYNTATHKHVKYYNFEKWEMEEYRKNQRRKAQRSSLEVPTEFNDEELLRLERKKQEQMEQKQEFDSLMRDFKMSKEKRAEHREHEMWQAEMQAAYKRGDTETVERLKAKLNPQEYRLRYTDSPI